MAGKIIQMNDDDIKNYIVLGEKDEEYCWKHAMQIKPSWLMQSETNSRIRRLAVTINFYNLLLADLKRDMIDCKIRL